MPCNVILTPNSLPIRLSPNFEMPRFKGTGDHLLELRRRSEWTDSTETGQAGLGGWGHGDWSQVWVGAVSTPPGLGRSNPGRKHQTNTVDWPRVPVTFVDISCFTSPRD